MSTYSELKEHVEFIADIANMMDAGVLKVVIPGSKAEGGRPTQALARALRESLNVLVGEVERARKIRSQRVLDVYEDAIAKDDPPGPQSLPAGHPAERDVG